MSFNLIRISPPANRSKCTAPKSATHRNGIMTFRHKQWNFRIMPAPVLEALVLAKHQSPPPKWPTRRRDFLYQHFRDFSSTKHSQHFCNRLDACSQALSHHLPSITHIMHFLGSCKYQLDRCIHYLKHQKWFSFLHLDCRARTATSSYQKSDTPPNLIKYVNEIIWRNTDHSRI